MAIQGSAWSGTTTSVPKEITGIANGLQETYRFKSPEALIDDFLGDVLEERGGS